MKRSESQINNEATLSKTNRACQLAKEYLKQKGKVPDDEIEQKFTLNNIIKLAEKMTAPNGESQGETEFSLLQVVLSVILAYYSLLSIPSQEVPKVAGVIENLDSLLENLENAFHQSLSSRVLVLINIYQLNTSIKTLQESGVNLSYFPLRATSEAYRRALDYFDKHASIRDKFIVRSGDLRMVSNRLAKDFQELQKKTNRSRPSDDQTSQAETPHGSLLDPSEAGEAHPNNGNSDIALPVASGQANTTDSLSTGEKNSAINALIFPKVSLRYRILSEQRAKIPLDNQEMRQWLDDVELKYFRLLVSDTQGLAQLEEIDDHLDKECSQRLQKLQNPNLFQALLNIFKRLLRLIGLSCSDPSHIIPVLEAIVVQVKVFKQNDTTERSSSEHGAEGQAITCPT